MNFHTFRQSIYFVLTYCSRQDCIANARYYFRHKEYQPAIGFYQRIIQRYPSHFEALFCLAKSFYHLPKNNKPNGKRQGSFIRLDKFGFKERDYTYLPSLSAIF